MKITIEIRNAAGELRAAANGENGVNLCFVEAYAEGDTIRLLSEQKGCYLMLQLEDAMPPALVYLAGTEFTLAVPFGEKHVSYSPKSFGGALHLLTARAAKVDEITARRNLAFNPFDTHENASLFPHAHANVETRGEAVFAARNAIDGNTANDSHGPWPYESWGINQRADAEITIEFGRSVCIDEVAVTLRADFPHDNWWEQATLKFSDGSEEILLFRKVSTPQTAGFSARNATWVTLCDLKKCQQDPSPFPALTQIEVWGREI